MRLPLLARAAVVVAILGLPPLTLGQTSLSDLVRGQVRLQLPTGSLINWENVKISIRSERGSSFQRSTETDDSGMYYFSGIPVGEYVLTVDAPDGQRTRYALAIPATRIYDVPPVTMKARRSYLAAFKDGMKEFEAGRWKEAIGPLRESVLLQPPGLNQRGQRVRLFSARIVPYAPHYYLAESLISMADCTGARQAMTSAQIEVVGTPLESQLTALRNRPCP